MSKEGIWQELILYHDKSEIDYILELAMNEYAEELVDIATDIYDSCIKQFYSSYEPHIYDRHGDISGYNLFYASDIGYSNLVVDMSFRPENLLPYYKMKKMSDGTYVPGKFEDDSKRAKVLGSVLKGIRARRSPKTPADFPMTWEASYPNEYSRRFDWASGFSTMNKIFDDFCENAEKDTNYMFWDILQKYV